MPMSMSVPERLERIAFVRLANGYYAGHWAGYYRATITEADTLVSLLNALHVARDLVDARA